MKRTMNLSKACSGLTAHSKSSFDANVYGLTDIGSHVNLMSTTSPFYAQQFMDENGNDEQSEYIKKGWLKYE